MKVRDLAKAVLSSERVKSSSPAFAQNLGLAMRADKRFRKVGRGVYSVRSVGSSKRGPSSKKRSKRIRSRKKAVRKPIVAAQQAS